MKKSIILYLLTGEQSPNYVIEKAFAENFNLIQNYDWCSNYSKNGYFEMQKEFYHLVKTKMPDYVFMQVQNPAMLNVDFVKQLSKYTKIIHWTGDVRSDENYYNWFAEIGEHIFLTLFSNQTDVEKLRKKGIAVDYLQVGFDNIWYNKNHNSICKYPDIVFCANNYGTFPLSNYRVEVVNRLTKKFGDDFKIFGNNWNGAFPVNNIQESQIYNNSKIAISVSQFAYKRYFSDRLLRIMGCGCLSLSHHYPEIEKDFTDGYDIVTFKNLDELIDKCNYYLSNESERIRISNNAYNTAHTKHTWDIRCKELLELIELYNL